jgi:hypothetical protein
MPCCGNPDVVSTTQTTTPPPTGDACLRAHYLCVCILGVDTWVLDAANSGCVPNSQCTGEWSCTDTESLLEQINGCPAGGPVPPLPVPPCDPHCCGDDTSTTTTSTTSSTTSSTTTTTTTTTTSTTTTPPPTTTTTTTSTTTTPPPITGMVSIFDFDGSTWHQFDYPGASGSHSGVGLERAQFQNYTNVNVKFTATAYYNGAGGTYVRTPGTGVSQNVLGDGTYSVSWGPN